MENGSSASFFLDDFAQFSKQLKALLFMLTHILNTPQACTGQKQSPEAVLEYYLNIIQTSLTKRLPHR